MLSKNAVDINLDLQIPVKGNNKKASKEANILRPSNSANVDQAIEDIYQKKTQLEHILLRPDTYIGSTERQQQKMWIHDGASIKLADIDYVPGLYKIFDEILVNAADNKVRDPKMDTLKVDINQVSVIPSCKSYSGLTEERYIAFVNKVIAVCLFQMVKLIWNIAKPFTI